MYSITLRGNIDSDDVEISENSHKEFQEKIEKLISSRMFLSVVPLWHEVI